MVVWHGMLSWLRIFGVPGRSLAPALASRTAAEKQDALDVVGLLHFAERAKRARPEPAFILSADAFLPVASRASAAGDALPEFQTIPGGSNIRGGATVRYSPGKTTSSQMPSLLRLFAVARREGMVSYRREAERARAEPAVIQGADVFLPLARVTPIASIPNKESRSGFLHSRQSSKIKTVKPPIRLILCGSIRLGCCRLN